MGAQVRGTLVRREQEFLWDRYRCKVAVHRRHFWDEDEMTVMGKPDNICAAIEMANTIIDFKIRIDACMGVHT